MSAVPLQFSNRNYKRYYGREAAAEGDGWYRPKDAEDLIFHLNTPFRRMRKKKIKSPPVKIVATPSKATSLGPQAVPTITPTMPILSTPKRKTTSSWVQHTPNTPWIKRSPKDTPTSPSASSSASIDSSSTQPYYNQKSTLFKTPDYNLEFITVRGIDRAVDEKEELIDTYKKRIEEDEELIKRGLAAHGVISKETEEKINSMIGDRLVYIKRLGKQIAELKARRKELEKAEE